MKLRKMIAAIGMLLMLPILCLPAFASGVSGTLYLNCSTHVDGQRRYFAGDAFALVKIADAEIDTSAEKPTVRYVTLPKFQQMDCAWDALSAEESHAKAKDLASAGVAVDDCMASVVTDVQGKAAFYNLDTALYLVVRTKAGEKNEAYFSDPFLVSVPLLMEDEINYTVTASPKYGWIPEEPVNPPEPPLPDKPAVETPTLPQTGQLNWPIPVLLIVGSVLIFIGWKKYKQN